MDKSVVVCDWLLLKNIVIRNFHLTTLGCYYRNMIVYYTKYPYTLGQLYLWAARQLVQSVQDTSSSNKSMPCTCFAIN